MSKSKEWDDVPEGRDKEPRRRLIVSDLNPWDERDERTDIQRERDLFKVQLQAAKRFGHTHDQIRVVEGEELLAFEKAHRVYFADRRFEDVVCEVCRLEGKIDSLDSYDWREEYDRRVENTMRPLERRMPGGAVY